MLGQDWYGLCDDGGLHPSVRTWETPASGNWDPMREGPGSQMSPLADMAGNWAPESRRSVIWGKVVHRPGERADFKCGET